MGAQDFRLLTLCVFFSPATGRCLVSTDSTGTCFEVLFSLLPGHGYDGMMMIDPGFHPRGPKVEILTKG